MNRFCTNCGKELKIDSDYCLNCGKYIEKKNRVVKHNTKTNTNTSNIDVLGVMGVVAGLVGFYISFVLALFSGNIKYEINSMLPNNIFYMLLFAFFYTVFGLALSTSGLIMSNISLKRKKSIMGMIGLVSSLITIVLCISIIIFFLK